MPCTQGYKNLVLRESEIKDSCSVADSLFAGRSRISATSKPTRYGPALTLKRSPLNEEPSNTAPTEEPSVDLIKDPNAVLETPPEEQGAGTATATVKRKRGEAAKTTAAATKKTTAAKLCASRRDNYIEKGKALAALVKPAGAACAETFDDAMPPSFGKKKKEDVVEPAGKKRRRKGEKEDDTAAKKPAAKKPAAKKPAAKKVAAKEPAAKKKGRLIRRSAAHEEARKYLEESDDDDETLFTDVDPGLFMDNPILDCAEADGSFNDYDDMDPEQQHEANYQRVMRESKNNEDHTLVVLDGGPAGQAAVIFRSSAAPIATSAKPPPKPPPMPPPKPAFGAKAVVVGGLVVCADCTPITGKQVPVDEAEDHGGSGWYCKSHEVCKAVISAFRTAGRVRKKPDAYVS